MEFNTSSINLITIGKDGGKDVLTIGLKEAYRAKPNYQRYMRQEYERGKDLDNNGIFKYIALKDDPDKGPVVETEWEDSRSLAEWLKEGHNDDEKRRVFRQVTNAISYMHSKGMVHGSLNASNVFITKKGEEVKLLTFKLRYTDILKQPQETLKYVAPEAKDGTVGLDVRADIYSLGMMLKDMGFNAEYHNVIEKCCRFGRNERFEDVSELIAQPSISSNKKMAVIIAVIVVLVCVAVALLVAQNGSDQSQQEPQQTEQNDSITTRDTSDQDSTNSEQPQVAQPSDSAQNEQASQEQGDNAFLNDLVPQMHADLDKIYNSGADPATIHAKVGAYYKGLRRVLKKQGKTSTQLDAFDKAFAEYTQQKNQ